jgi:ATP-binding cassette subfamily F protein 3
MSLVSVLNLSISFVGKALFHEIGLQVETGERVGLVGPNGSGKTTLMRLLIGEMSPDKGEIKIAKGTRIGYLQQDVHETLSGTILQSTLEAVPNRIRLRQEMNDIEQALSDDPDEEAQVKLATRLAQIHQEIGDLDMAFPVHRAEKILTGLGFKPDELHNRVDTLSGGWKMRAALASILYQNPDLLLLDEPTNHLDLPSVRWLEEFLEDYRGAMVLICHDKDFLNRQIRRVVSFEPEGLRSYSGNYDFYLKAREEEKKSLEAKARNQEQRVKEAKKFVDRFRAKSSKARQAQSKIKLIEKMDLIKTHKTQKTVRFSFPEVSRSGRDVITLDGVSKCFDHKNLYSNLDLRVFRGERVAVIGPNGSGKTTLLRMVAGELAPDQGRIHLGSGVAMSYYAQHHSEMLNPGKTILEEVYQAVPHETISFVRGVCGAFLFSGEDVDKSIGVLSGGERARVSLAKILVKPGNLLIMDEPTNHLDIISSEILIDALADFNGTLFFVSHNLSFVNRLATKIWDIKNETIFEYPGRLHEYYDHLSREEQGAPIPAKKDKTGDLKEKPSAEKIPNRKSQRKEKAEKRRLINDTLRPVREKLNELETRIDELEAKKKELEGRLADPDTFKDKEQSVPLLNEYGKVKRKLDELLGRWEFQHEKLESEEKKLGLR